MTIDRVLIVGTGWVGRQVAAKFASCGIEIALVDRSTELAEQARQWMHACTDAHDPLNLHSLSSNREDSSIAPAGDQRAPAEPVWLENVQALPGLTEIGVENVNRFRPQLVLECVPEQLSLKKRCLRRICELVGADCLIASNSSYFVPSVLSAFVTHPQRFAHLHFHVPVLRNTVADVVGCDETSRQTIDALVELCQRVGQEPLVLRHEHPGYVFNWLLQALLKAALELVAQDVVDAEDVDRSWKSISGMPVGPFGMMDQIGIDVIEQVLSNARWANASGVSDQQLLDLIRPMIDSGRLGVKSGRGFYDYRGEE